MRRWSISCLILGSVLSILNLDSKGNVVLYWGQNSYGKTYSQRDLWEKPLRYYCDDSYVDVINLGFLIKYNTNGLPEINFSKHCGLNADHQFHSYECPEISKDIEYCQINKQKTILLSLGGDIAYLGFGSSYEATQFASLLWNMFMGGQHQQRPFGKVILDGIDLDIEHGTQSYYNLFLSKLREHYKSSNRPYFITAAPQCVFPDENLGEIMNNNHIDAAFIQFYNNPCGVDKGNKFNYQTWSNWAKTQSYNSQIKLMVGIPASSTAAGSGYIPPSQLKSLIDTISTDPNFGGIMIWDASQTMNNLVKGINFTMHMKLHLMNRELVTSMKLLSQPTNNNQRIYGWVHFLIMVGLSSIYFV